MEKFTLFLAAEEINMLRTLLESILKEKDWELPEIITSVHVLDKIYKEYDRQEDKDRQRKLEEALAYTE